MKSPRNSTLALIERVARVRETQAQQELVKAHARERERQAQAGEAEDLLRKAEHSMASLQARERLDVARLTLLADLAGQLDLALVERNEALAKQREVRQERLAECSRRAKYRERVQCCHDAAARKGRLAIEAFHQDENLGTWLVNMRKEKSGD